MVGIRDPGFQARGELAARKGETMKKNTLVMFGAALVFLLGCDKNEQMDAGATEVGAAVEDVADIEETQEADAGAALDANPGATETAESDGGASRD